MNLLLDTCAIIWIVTNPNKLSSAARAAIGANPKSLLASAISAFEISLKQKKNKLKIHMGPRTWWFDAVKHHKIQVLPVTDDIAIASTELPFLHPDPCDRIIMATAQLHSASIITSDALITQYPSAQVIW